MHVAVHEIDGMLDIEGLCQGLVLVHVHENKIFAEQLVHEAVGAGRTDVADTDDHCLRIAECHVHPLFLKAG